MAIVPEVSRISGTGWKVWMAGCWGAGSSEECRARHRGCRGPWQKSHASRHVRGRCGEVVGDMEVWGNEGVCAVRASVHCRKHKRLRPEDPDRR